MEPVWARLALELQMTARGRAIWMIVLAMGALAPVAAWGHSTDFILVKATPHAGRIEVELTADYGGNPMFASEADARSVLARVLRVKAGGRSWDFTTLAPPSFRAAEAIRSDRPRSAGSSRQRRSPPTAVGHVVVEVRRGSGDI